MTIKKMIQSAWRCIQKLFFRKKVKQINVTRDELLHFDTEELFSSVLPQYPKGFSHQIEEEEVLVFPTTPIDPSLGPKTNELLHVLEALIDLVAKEVNEDPLIQDRWLDFLNRMYRKLRQSDFSAITLYRDILNPRREFPSLKVLAQRGRYNALMGRAGDLVEDIRRDAEHP